MESAIHRFRFCLTVAVIVFGLAAEAKTAAGKKKKPEPPKENPTYVNDSAKGENAMLVLGDSITVSDCNETHSKDGRCGWRRNLAKECGKPDGFYSFDTVAKIGRSVGANAESLPKARFDGRDVSFIKKKRYKGVLVMLGVNDVDRNGNVLDAVKENYTKMIATLNQQLQGPPQITFISVLPSCRTKETPNLSKNIRAVNAYLKSLETSGALAQASAGAPWRESLAGANACKKGSGPISFIDIYSKLATTRTLDLTQKDKDGNVIRKYQETRDGCLPKEYSEPDLLHPKTDASTGTQAALSKLIAVGMKEKGIAGCGR